MEIRRGFHNPLPFRDHPESVRSYTLRGFVTRVVDGDTFDALLESLPRHVLVTERVRLENVDAAEVYGSNRDPVRGPAAKALAEALLLNKPVLVHVEKETNTFGRIVACLSYRTEGRWEDFGAALEEAGLTK